MVGDQGAEGRYRCGVPWRAAWILLGVVAIATAVGAREASARIVISEPPMVRACPGAKTWPLVERCLAAQGAVQLERSLPKAKLVRVVMHEDQTTYDAGIYLYLQRPDGSWSLGGMFTGGMSGGSSYTVLELAPETIERHTGYRLEIGQITRTTSSLDGATSVPILLRTRRVLFCAGTSYGCPDATTQCDVITHGKALFTFRSTLVFETGLVRVVGDRSHAGAACNTTERVFLGWPAGPKPQ